MAKIENLVDELECMFQMRAWRLNDLTALTNDVTVLMEKKKVERFLQIVMDMANNTRTWLNNGHTAIELHRIMADVAKK